jgi:two-component system, chemotaxis family, response regulator Rcp1
VLICFRKSVPGLLRGTDLASGTGTCLTSKARLKGEGQVQPYARGGSLPAERVRVTYSPRGRTMPHSHLHRMIEVLLIEDNPGDVRLLEEAFRELKANVHMQVAKDGAEGLQMVFPTAQPKTSRYPDIILLDLNLPKVSGHDVLSRIKNNPETCRIPVIILTSSRAESDVRRAYESHANAYLRKPSTLDGLIAAAQQIKSFWMETATLPS